MANLKASKKDIRQSAKKRERNLAARTALKTYVKNVRKAIEEGDKDKIQSSLRTAIRYLDKAEKRGVIHSKQAARRKSRIAAQASKAISA